MGGPALPKSLPASPSKTPEPEKPYRPNQRENRGLSHAPPGPGPPAARAAAQSASASHETLRSFAQRPPSLVSVQQQPQHGHRRAYAPPSAAVTPHMSTRRHRLAGLDAAASSAAAWDWQYSPARLCVAAQVALAVGPEHAHSHPG